MTKKFRIVIRNMEKADNTTFTIIAMDERIGSSFIAQSIKNYMEAETEHDIAEDRPPMWVVISGKGEKHEQQRRKRVSS